MRKVKNKDKSIIKEITQDNALRIRKEIVQDENVITLYNILGMLYHNYSRSSVPKHLVEKLKETYDAFYEEYSKDYEPELDIGNDDFVEHIEFISYETEQKFPKAKISLYDLLTIYKNGGPMPERVKLYLGSQEIIYVLYLDTADDSFLSYTLEDESLKNESEGVMEYLADCLLEGNYFDKCIEILD